MSIFMTRVIREAIEKGKNANKNNNKEPGDPIIPDPEADDDNTDDTNTDDVPET